MWAQWEGSVHVNPAVIRQKLSKISDLLNPDKWISKKNNYFGSKGLDVALWQTKQRLLVGVIQQYRNRAIPPARILDYA